MRSRRYIRNLKTTCPGCGKHKAVKVLTGPTGLPLVGCVRWRCRKCHQVNDSWLMKRSGSR